MHRWIRDRMKRRKKKSSETTGTTETTPLQPVYPDLTETAQELEPETAIEKDVPAEAQETLAPERARPKRRRRKKPAQAGAAPVEEPAPESAQPVPEAAGDEPSAGAETPEVAAPTVTATEEVASAEPLPAQTATPQTPPAPSVRKGSKGAVVLAVGLPGSGKSTWFKRHGVTPLSSDMVRHLLFDDATEQRYQDLVFGTLRSLLRARLISRMPMNYVDATNLSPKERRHWIRMAKDFGYDAHAVYFDVPMEVCMERNRRRNRVVPEDVMQRMTAKLRPPAFDEGFAKIVVVRVKSRAEGSGEESPEASAETS
jgi:predicted kinase